MKNSGIEWIGEIPDDWEVISVKHYCTEIFAGGTPDSGKSEYWDGDINWIPSGECHDKKINSVPKTITQLGFEKSSTKMIPANTPVLAMTGATCGNTGFLTISSCANQSVCSFISQSKLCDSLFLWYLLRSSKNYILSFQSGGAQGGINVEVCKNLRVPLVPFHSQKDIATYLDKKCSKIEETIQNQQQVIEKLKAYKQSLITEAVTGKIKIQNGKVCGKYESYKDSGVEYLGKIPSNWNIKRLRYIGKCQNGISKGGEFFGSGYPFVSYGDVYNNLTLPENVSGLIETTPEEQDNYSVMAGDIFFTRTSETIEEVGFTSVCLKTIEKATFAGFVIRVRPFTEDLIPDYSKYYFSSDAHRRFFVKEMNLVTRASLSQDLLKRLPVLIPSKDEQKEIADYLDKKCQAIDTAIEQKQKLIEKLTEYKKSLIYECVTGKKAI